MTTTSRRPGGRSARVRRSVLDATIRALQESGLHSISIADVAERAGVHESSIYRRWGNAQNLIVEALLDEAEELLPVPDTGNVRGDLTEYLRALAAYLRSPGGEAFDRSLAAMGTDPAADDLRARYWDVRYGRSGSIVERAVERGELAADTDVRFTVELLVAPLHFKVVMTREPLDDRLPERIVDALLPGLAPRAAE